MGKGRKIVEAVDSGIAAAFFKRDVSGLRRTLEVAKKLKQEPSWSRYYVKLMHDKGVSVSVLQRLNEAVDGLKKQIRRGEPPEVNPFAKLPLVAALSAQIYYAFEDGSDVSYKKLPCDKRSARLRKKLVEGLRHSLRGMLNLCRDGEFVWTSEKAVKLLSDVLLKLEQAWDPEEEAYEEKGVAKIPAMLEKAFVAARKDYLMRCNLDKNQLRSLSPYMWRTLVAYVPNKLLEFQDRGRFVVQRNARKTCRIIDALVHSRDSEGWVKTEVLKKRIGVRYRSGGLGKTENGVPLRLYVESDRRGRVRLVGKARVAVKYAKG